MHGLTIAQFADYSDADLCRCGALIGVGERECPSCARRRVWARRKAERLAEMARAQRVHVLIARWWAETEAQ